MQAAPLAQLGTIPSPHDEHDGPASKLSNHSASAQHNHGRSRRDSRRGLEPSQQKPRKAKNNYRLEKGENLRLEEKWNAKEGYKLAFIYIRGMQKGQN